MATVNIGLLGLGTVGTSVINVLQRNKIEITRRAGCNINVTHLAVKDITKDRSCDLSAIKISTDPLTVVDDPDVDIIIEVIDGIEPAYSALRRAIERGKPNVTANKALLAEYGNELFTMASKYDAPFAFEAAVAGGIPIVKVLREGLTANKINYVAGIINGASNYILTQMSEYHMEFAQALQQAQNLGYTEADPSFDLNGIDAAHKLTILASIAFGVPLQFQKVYTEGIDFITSMPIEECETSYYLRLFVQDCAGVLADITHILADQGISIEILLQKEAVTNNHYVPVVLVTHKICEAKMQNALTEMRQLDTVDENITFIRIERLNSISLG